MKRTTFSAADVAKIAGLANIPVSGSESEDLAEGFTTTLTVVDRLMEIDVTGTEQTNQVTGLENVLREDATDPDRMLTQEQALSGAKRTHNGFFVVDRILED